jgi:A/G-specific adenine glycosylase
VIESESEVVSSADTYRALAMGPALEGWFGTRGREFPWRTWSDPYAVAVAEVLLQRTRAEVVASFIGPFLARYPTAVDLSSATVEELELALQRVGLQRRRAMSLREMATDLVYSPTRPWIERSGVGQYVSRAIDVALRRAPVAMVDSNFIRIIRRAFDGPWKAEYRTDRRLQSIAQSVIDGSSDSRTANWAVLDLGALVCVPRTPRCRECPLQSLCLTGLETL